MTNVKRALIGQFNAYYLPMGVCRDLKNTTTSYRALVLILILFNFKHFWFNKKITLLLQYVNICVINEAEYWILAEFLFFLLHFTDRDNTVIL